ncbi:MAG: site-specific integrase, partial [Candidatus Acidiferrum sp.]
PRRERNSMSVYKQEGSKYFWYGFTFKGRRVQKSTKVTNQREAENIEKAAWTQLARGEVAIADKPEAERKTVGNLLDALVEDFKARKKDSVKNLNLVATVRKDLGDKWADTLTTAGIKDYVSTLRKAPRTKQKGRRSKSLADSTIKHRLQILASAFELENFAREEAKLPLLLVPRFPKLTQDNARDGFLNRAPFDVLYSHLPADLKDFALFAYLTGWRKSAIANLEWSDVRDGNIYLRGVYSKNKKPYFVPIIGELVQLTERREEAAIKMGTTIVLDSPVFHRDGARIDEFRKSWATACEKAGCEGLLFHDLRRSAARQLIRSGTSKDVAKMVGGWKTDSMFSRYNVTGEEDLRAAMEAVTKYNEAESKKVVAMGAGR